MSDQKPTELQQFQLVRFGHERNGGPVHRVVSVMADGMVELHDMGGYFAQHLFVIADDVADIPPDRSAGGPLDDITIRYHSAVPNWCKLNGLEIRAVPECEGGGFMVRRDQAEAIIALLQLPGVNEHGN